MYRDAPTERVTVLNPASFGKLVRVLFPGLKTRRLGVRGESKYHYVNFSLKDDQPELVEAQNNLSTQNFNDPPNFTQSFRYLIPIQVIRSLIYSSFLHSMHMHSQFPVDSAAFPSPDVPQMPEQHPPVQRSEGFDRPHSLYNQPEIHGVHQLDSTTSKISQRLRFAPPTVASLQEYEPITLPKIEPFVPTGTDTDSATALSALYRSHCTSLVECIRFCKEKTFFHLFTSFHGTLTMPVQKLFANPSIAPWIEACDFAMYQKMMRVVAPLTLQVAPKPVLDTLRNISERLVLHIRTSFQGQPGHVIQAKGGTRDTFCRLVGSRA